MKSPISSLLGKSPFKPMQKHMQVVTDCAHLLPGLFEALCEKNFARINTVKDEIFAKEHEADEIKFDLQIHLPKSLLMPVARGDLIKLLSQQDLIAGVCQDIAGLLVQREMPVPDSMKDPLLTLVGQCVEACDKGLEIINHLDELVETGFRGRETERVEKLVSELNEIESKTDILAIDLAKILFEHEDEMKPVTVMFWYQLIQWIGRVADEAERVGNRLHLMMAR